MKTPGLAAELRKAPGFAKVSLFLDTFNYSATQHTFSYCP